MNFKKSDPMSSGSETRRDSLLSNADQDRNESGTFAVGMEKSLTQDVQSKLCLELAAFRSLLEKLADVPQGNSAWTWDHETRTFLLQAPNQVIEQYINILTREMGEALCLRVKKAKIVVDLWPWKINKDKASLRIGFNEGYNPIELRGFTGLESLVNLHFVSYPNDSQQEKDALVRFKLMCRRIDAIFEKNCEWMWETYWRMKGLVFAIVRKYTWEKKSSLIEKEIEQFNNSPEAPKAGLMADLRTYTHGTSVNVRIALEGLSNEPKLYPQLLPVFDAHFSG
ncbi:hypothetical protein ASZ90_006131 [hydrocarbon metagenome]|uniref:Uncharacterized protein n=1 Tax=hydrocarbon metagenome TaxID=938273 RepID=A0A0W8FT31_9ZZZZ